MWPREYMKMEKFEKDDILSMDGWQPGQREGERGNMQEYR
jgi:hypothetical protein